MRDDRGQAMLAAVLALAIAAIAVVGLRAAQERIVATARVQRAGEAAAEAAAQRVADLYVSRAVATRELLRDPRVVESARSAAEELAQANGADGVERMELLCVGGRVEARLLLNGYSHHAGFSAPECSPS